MKKTNYFTIDGKKSNLRRGFRDRYKYIYILRINIVWWHKGEAV